MKKKIFLTLFIVLLAFSGCNSDLESRIVALESDEGYSSLAIRVKNLEEQQAFSYSVGSIAQTNIPYLDNAEYIDLDVNAGDPDIVQGRMFWDQADSTASLYLNSDVTLQLGQEQHVYVRNNTGTDWPNGVAGIATGSLAYRPTAVLANSAYITTCAAQGMTTQAIAKNESGFATTFGLVRSFDTSDWAEGAALYVSSVSGQLTTTVPTSGYNVIFGRVLRSHPNDGIIFVLPRDAPYFGDIIGGNYSAWDYKGTMTAYGGARVYKNEWFSVDGLSAPGTKPATLVEWGIAQGWEFTNGTDDTLTAVRRLPTDLDRTEAPQFRIGFASDTNSGAVVWQFSYSYVQANEDTRAAAQEVISVTQTIAATAGGLTIASITGMDEIDTSDQLLMVQIKRLGNDGADTLADDCVLLGAGMLYVSDKRGVPID